VRIHEIVTRLVGPVNAVGETNADVTRYNNLVTLTDLIDHLLQDVRVAAAAANRPEASMRKIGQYAHEFIEEIERQSNDIIEEIKRQSDDN